MKSMPAPSLLALILALALVFTWGSSTVRAADGKAVYESKCAMCHGPTGEGNGPGAALCKTKPKKFSDPSFWQGDVNQKINQAVMGKGAMAKVNLSPDELKAVSAYITQNFKP